MVNFLNPAPAWVPGRSRAVRLYHGCTAVDAQAIAQGGINVHASRYSLDFGRGFYTTTVLRQARQWAWLRYFGLGKPQQANNQPATVSFTLARHELATLWTLAFVRGSYDDEDYWGLVQHCRRSVNATPGGAAGRIHDHDGPRSDGTHRWYDVVYGPAAAMWRQRVAMRDADQVSFHTGAAITALNDLVASKDRRLFRWDPVVP